MARAPGVGVLLGAQLPVQKAVKKIFRAPIKCGKNLTYPACQKCTPVVDI